MVVTEITLVGWLISTPTDTNPTLWFIGAFGAVLLGVAISLCTGKLSVASIK